MRAYIPTAVVLIVLLTIFGIAPGMIFLFGIVAGFAVYEFVHYRMHFSTPASALEPRRRARIQSQTMKGPYGICGVRRGIGDVVFGSEPQPERMRERAAAGA